jgi:hypothetical protein
MDNQSSSHIFNLLNEEMINMFRNYISRGSENANPTNESTYEAPIHNTRNTSRPPNESTNRNDVYLLQLQMVIDLISQYNHNFSLYQEYMNSMLNTINNINNDNQPTHRSSHLHILNENRENYNSAIIQYNENIQEMIDLIRTITRNHQNIRNTFPRYQNLRYNNTNPYTSLFTSTRPSGNTSRSNGLSQRQITLATRTILYTTDHRHTVCPITLEEFTENEQVCEIIGCNHIFKPAALMRWFERNVKCPVCRYDLRNYRQNRNAGMEPRDAVQTIDDALNEMNINTVSDSMMNGLSTFLDQINDTPEFSSASYTFEIPLYFSDASFTPFNNSNAD